MVKHIVLALLLIALAGFIGHYSKIVSLLSERPVAKTTPESTPELYTGKFKKSDEGRYFVVEDIKMDGERAVGQILSVDCESKETLVEIKRGGAVMQMNLPPDYTFKGFKWIEK